MSPELTTGFRFTWNYRVPAKATVPRLYDDVPFCLEMPDVLATGYLVGIMELACIQALQPYLDWPQEQSLGTLVNFTHLAPTLPGTLLTVNGELVQVNGRRLGFVLEAYDGTLLVSQGSHERHVILRDRFNARLQALTNAGMTP